MVADSLALLSINNNNQTIFQAISNCGKQKRYLQVFCEVSEFSNKISMVQKMVLSSSQDRIIFKDLRLRGQGLQNVSSRPRTSSRTPPLVQNLLTFGDDTYFRKTLEH